MQRGLTQEQISRHFTRLESGNYQVNLDLRKWIQFENINLIKPWQVSPKSDLILMRNILIYFNQEKKQMVLSKMRDQLSDAGGYLMLGASESILFDASFKLHRSERVSYYSKA
jgi:chemotaxis protein methyltransferase CheR